MTEEEDKKTQTFISITNSSPQEAKAYLESSNWNIEAAVESYFNGDSTSGVGASSVSQSKLSSFKADDDDDDDDDDNDDEKNYYTGGEKSALAVEKPNSRHKRTLGIVDDLLKRAQQTAQEVDSDDGEGQKTSKFSGVGFRLGDESTPSEQIPDPEAGNEPLPKVERLITFYKNGFTIGDGPLYSYEDPNNRAYLQEFQKGRAPLVLLDIKEGQRVDVKVSSKIDQDWTPAKRRVGGYQGQGHRLGSPVPGEIITETPQVSQIKKEKEAEKPKPKPDQGDGDSTVQLRLADGRRVIRKVFASGPVEQLYEYIDSQATSSREYTLATTFPMKVLEDRKQTIKDAGLINAVVVQRWKLNE